MNSNRRGSKEQLAEYFKRNLKKGYTVDSLKWALISQGYSRVIVEMAMDEAQKAMAKEAPPFREKPKIDYQVIDKEGKAVEVKGSFWQKIVGFFSGK